MGVESFPLVQTQRFGRRASQWPIISDGIVGGIEGGYKNPGRVKSQGTKTAFNG
jgi:hypothetical protein